MLNVLLSESMVLQYLIRKYYQPLGSWSISMNEDVDLGEVPKVVVGGGTQATLLFKFK